MKFRQCLLLIKSLLLTSTFGLCNAEVKTSDWSGEGSFGAIINTGTTDTTNVNLGIDLQRRINDWAVKVEIATDYGETQAADNANRKSQKTLHTNEFNLELSYDIGNKFIGFGKGEFREDVLSDLDYVGSFNAGLGYRFYNEEQFKWLIKVGLGEKTTRHQDPAKNQNESNLDLNSELSYSFNEDVSFSNNIVVRPSEANTETKLELSLTAKLSRSLSARVNYERRQGSIPNDNNYDAETKTRISLIYKFGK